jgi:phosphatidate cytidylyltransferase
MSPLSQRVATAAVLLPLALVAIFALSSPWFALVALVVVVAAALEWSTLAHFTSARRWGFLAVLVAGAGALAWRLWSGDGRWPDGVVNVACGIAAAFWIVVAPAWVILRAPVTVSAGMTPIGWIVLGGFWVALVELHARSPWLLLAAMAVVWIADTAAFFSGRAFGLHKLAPAVSPGKTWEGVAGALLAVAVYAVACAWLVARPGLAAEPRPATLAVWLLVGLTLAAVSVIGDLYESWLKRAAGVKDSGRLLPGHGGILDRIDALLAALPLAALAANAWLP